MTWNTYADSTLSFFPCNTATDLRFGQRTAPTWDGDTTPGGENATLTCGETSLSAFIFWSTGVYIPPDSLKGAILDTPGSTDKYVTGPTSLGQLRNALKTIAGCATTVLTPTTVDGNATGSLLNLVWAATNNGRPVLELRWWDHAGSGFYHWAVALGLNETTVFVFDPWSGSIIQETYQQHGQMYVGAAVPGGGICSLDRPRDPYL